MVLITHITPPDQGLMYTASNIKLKLGDKLIGNGTIYLTPDTLAWQPDELPEGVSILWKQISVHGISTNPTKCIYFMLDHKVEWAGVYDGKGRATNGHNGVDVGGGEPMEQQPVIPANNEEDEGNETDEEEEAVEDEAAGGGDYAEASEMTECWLIPAENEVHSVDTIFRIMTECQAMHPDSADSISDESDFMDEDGPGALMPDANNGHAEAVAQGGMQNLSLDDDERFEDADE